jgi:hypothetical protein
MTGSVGKAIGLPSSLEISENQAGFQDEIFFETNLRPSERILTLRLNLTDLIVIMPER